jgi:hypothetical protein
MICFSADWHFHRGTTASQSWIIGHLPRAIEFEEIFNKLGTLSTNCDVDIG